MRHQAHVPHPPHDDGEPSAPPTRRLKMVAMLAAVLSVGLGAMVVATPEAFVEPGARPLIGADSFD